MGIPNFRKDSRNRRPYYQKYDHECNRMQLHIHTNPLSTHWAGLPWGTHWEQVWNQRPVKWGQVTFTLTLVFKLVWSVLLVCLQEDLTLTRLTRIWKSLTAKFHVSNFSLWAWKQNASYTLNGLKQIIQEGTFFTAPPSGWPQHRRCYSMEESSWQSFPALPSALYKTQGRFAWRLTEERKVILEKESCTGC